MASAEDDDLPQPGPQAAADPTDDVVDDAADVCVLFFLVPKWVGVVLGRVKPDGRCYSVFYNRFRGAIARVTGTATKPHFGRRRGSGDCRTGGGVRR